jgi:signal recognition particle subunit SRP54
MIPGLGDMLNGAGGGAEDGQLRIKRMIYITDSMTSYELDSDGMCFIEMAEVHKENANGKLETVLEPVGLSWRVKRVAKGSGTSVREVEELLCQYLMMANMAKAAGGKNGWCVRAFCECFSRRASPNVELSPI